MIDILAWTNETWSDYFYRQGQDKNLVTYNMSQ